MTTTPPLPTASGGRAKPLRLSERQILDAARACVLAAGVHDTTLNDVARRAGVSRMTLYRRYSDIGSLISEVLGHEFARILRENTEPEILMPYLINRFGSTQQIAVNLLANRLDAGYRDGSIKKGSIAVQAHSIVLTAQAFIISAAATGPIPVTRLLDELGAMLDAYLAPDTNGQQQQRTEAASTNLDGAGGHTH